MISVVVPVYNVENYLHYAIESLMKQTYRGFEVILVDDGSTDDSGKLCDEYASKYPNIFTYHKDNGGLSDARNFGIEKSKGEFITFLDPDDYLEEYALELLIGIQRKYDVDMVSTRVKTTEKYDDYSKYVLKDGDFRAVRLMDNKEFLMESLYDKVATVSACGKLYRRNILEMKFPKGKIYEDLYIVSEHLEKVDRVAHTNIKIYNYYQREGSIVNSVFTEKQYDFFEAINHIRKVIDFSYENDKNLQQAVTAKETQGSFKLSFLASKSDMDQVEKIRRIIKRNKKSIFLNSRIKMKFKVKYSIFILSPNIFYKLKALNGR